MHIELPKPVTKAIGLLESAGFEAWVVGGAVRDAMAAEMARASMQAKQGNPAADGKEQATGEQHQEQPAPQDWDLTTNALPAQMQAVFAGERVIETGLKHGTLTVLMDGLPLEITTYRVDGTYTDNRRPDSVQFTGRLEEDLARRDFTVNAMAYHPVRGLCDPYGGAEDLAAGIIRCVGEPGKEGEPVRRFSEDALRILRALRFAAVRGMQIEPETKAAVFSEKDRLLNISAERIREELDKLLHGDYCADILIDYAEVIAVVIPEMRACIGFDQHTAYHKYNVWDHCAHAAENARMSMATATALQEAAIEEVKAEVRNNEVHSSEAASAEAKNAEMRDAAVQMRWISSVRQGISCLKWAAMLHDIEKPACFFQTDDGNGHFYGHSEKSAETADRILERLKFDNARREKILMLIANHDRQFVLDVKPVKRAIRKFGKQDLLLLMDLYSADVSAQSELAFDRLRGHDIMRAAVMQLSKEPEAAFSRKDLAVNGRDMMALGYEGEAIGDILESLLDAVIEESLPNEREALLAFAEQKKEN